MPSDEDIICPKCDDVINETSDLKLLCDVCSLWIHANCLNISKKVCTSIKVLKSNNVSWACSMCIEKMSDLVNSKNKRRRSSVGTEGNSQLLNELKKIEGNILEKIELLHDAVLETRNQKHTTEAQINTETGLGNGFTLVPPGHHGKRRNHLIKKNSNGTNSLPHHHHSGASSNNSPPVLNRSPSVQNTAGRLPNELDWKAPPLNRKSRKQKEKPIVGTSSSTNLRSVRPRPEGTKRLFVSRLDPKTTEDDVQQNIKSLNVEAKVTRIKSKFDHYASFCVETSREGFDTLNDANSWGEGILVLPYYNRVVNPAMNETIVG